MIEKLRADPHWREIQSRLEAAGASEAFILGTLKHLARIPVVLRYHDRNFGTDRENLVRRVALARSMRKVARAAKQDVDARMLTLLELDNDAGPYRIQWLAGLHAYRPTIARALEEAAQFLESKSGPGTIHFRRDVVLRVADELYRRLAVAAEVTGKARPRLPRLPRAAIAAIASILLDEKVSVDAAKKIVDRATRQGQTAA